MVVVAWSLSCRVTSTVNPFSGGPETSIVYINRSDDEPPETHEPPNSGGSSEQNRNLPNTPSLVWLLSAWISLGLVFSGALGLRL